MTINPDVDGGKCVGVPPSGSGHSPKGGAASASPAKPSVPNAVYAVAPQSWCADYFTPGKSYLVEREDGGGGFTVTNDTGSASYCLWEYCAHLRPSEGPCGSWTRLEHAASAIEAAEAGETGPISAAGENGSGSTEGESPAPKGDAQC